MNFAIILNYLKYIPLVIEAIKLFESNIKAIKKTNGEIDFQENLTENEKNLRRNAVLQRLIASGISESDARKAIEIVLHYKKITSKFMETYANLDKGL
jgi:hypothetical protein